MEHLYKFTITVILMTIWCQQSIAASVQYVQRPSVAIGDDTMFILPSADDDYSSSLSDNRLPYMAPISAVKRSPDIDNNNIGLKRNQEELDDCIDNTKQPFERNGQFPKRAPLGFMGMRGKKVLADHIRMNANNNNYQLSEFDANSTDMDNRRGPGGILVMRGKKEFIFTEHQLQQLRSLLQQARAENAPEGLGQVGAKRDPAQGFMGVRGKRLLSHLLGMNADDLEKRDAPSMGFVGMRGKKWTNSDQMNSED